MQAKTVPMLAVLFAVLQLLSPITRAQSAATLPAHSLAEHRLVVEGGSGSGAYKAKSIVTVTAPPAPAGKYFDKWLVRGGLIERPAHSSTQLAMPDADLELTPTYADIASSKRIRVACVGDSITAFGWPEVLQDLLGEQYEVRNFGIPSTTVLVKSGRPYMKNPAYQAVQDFKPNIVIVTLGTNDTRRDKPNTFQNMVDFVPDYMQLLSAFPKLETRPRIYLGIPTPMYGEGNWGLNEESLQAGVIPAIRTVAANLKLPLIDFHTPLSGHPEWFKDRVHPTREGRPAIAATAYRAITDKEAMLPSKTN